MGVFFWPVLIFWVAGAVYSLRLGYLILADAGVAWVLGAIVATLALVWGYVRVGLRQFRYRQEILPFEIEWFFLLNRYALLAYVFALGAYAQAFFGADWDAVVFVVAASASFGSLVGCFLSKAFIDKQGIARKQIVGSAGAKPRETGIGHDRD